MANVPDKAAKILGIEETKPLPDPSTPSQPVTDVENVVPPSSLPEFTETRKMYVLTQTSLWGLIAVKPLGCFETREAAVQFIVHWVCDTKIDVGTARSVCNVDDTQTTFTFSRVIRGWIRNGVETTVLRLDTVPVFETGSSISTGIEASATTTIPTPPPLPSSPINNVPIVNGGGGGSRKKRSGRRNNRH